MANDGLASDRLENSERDPLAIFRPPRQKAVPPPKATFAIKIDSNEPGISSDEELTLRALHEDVRSELEFTGLLRRITSGTAAERTVCAIVAASQFARKLRGLEPAPDLMGLIENACRFIIIDDRQLYTVPATVHAREITLWQAADHLVTAPALREDPDTGIKHGSLIDGLKIHLLLHEVFDRYSAPSL